MFKQSPLPLYQREKWDDKENKEAGEKEGLDFTQPQCPAELRSGQHCVAPLKEISCILVSLGGIYYKVASSGQRDLLLKWNFFLGLRA